MWIVLILNLGGGKQYQKRYGFNNLKFENYSVKLMDSLQTMNEK